MVRERLHVGPPSRLHSEFSDNPATVPSPVAAARLASVRPPTPPVSISTPRSMSPLVGHLADDLENAFPLESLPLLHHHHHSPSPMLLMAKSSSSSTSTPQSRREGARTPIGSEIAPSDPALSPVSSLGSPPAPLRDRTPSLSSSLKRQRHVRSFLTGSPNGGIVATAPRRSSRRGSAPRMSTASTFGADLSDSDALDLSEDEEDCVAWDVSAADARLSYTDVRDNVVVDAGVNDADDDDCHPTPCHCDAHDRDCSDGPCTTRALYMECTNASCGLGVACRNRRIQRREYARVRVFRTEVKGFGVMADHAPIPTGTFVTEYRGELINGKSLKRRYGDPSVPAPPRLAPAGAALATRSRQQQPNQQSHLDAGAHRPGYVVWIEDDGYIDAGTHGSVARFTNHSCNPNCAIEKWIVDGSYRLVLKTLRDVALGEELTWNYGSHYGGAGKLICKCGADTCAGVIGGAERRPTTTTTTTNRKTLCEMCRRSLGLRPNGSASYSALPASNPEEPPSVSSRSSSPTPSLNSAVSSSLHGDVAAPTPSPVVGRKRRRLDVSGMATTLGHPTTSTSLFDELAAAHEIDQDQFQSVLAHVPEHFTFEALDDAKGNAETAFRGMLANVLVNLGAERAAATTLVTTAALASLVYAVSSLVATAAPLSVGAASAVDTAIIAPQAVVTVPGTPIPIPVVVQVLKSHRDAHVRSLREWVAAAARISTSPAAATAAWRQHPAYAVDLAADLGFSAAALKQLSALLVDTGAVASSRFVACVTAVGVGRTAHAVALVDTTGGHALLEAWMDQCARGHYYQHAHRALTPAHDVHVVAGYDDGELVRATDDLVCIVVAKYLRAQGERLPIKRAQAMLAQCAVEGIPVTHMLRWVRGEADAPVVVL